MHQRALTFWTAAAPSLARNTKTLRDQAQAYEARDITREQYDHADMMERNRIFNMAFGEFYRFPSSCRAHAIRHCCTTVWQSAGEIVILAILVGILFALHVNDRWVPIE